MEKNRIITELYLDKDINEAFKKMHPPELVEDLKQEVFLVLCNMNDERLIDMYEKRVIKFFIVRTMLNMIQSNTSEFFKLYRKPYEEVNFDLKDTIYEEYNSEKLYIVFNELHWYEREVFKLYIEKRNIKIISKETLIPYRSILKTISKIRLILKTKLKND